MIPETSVPSCLRARRQRITQASAHARSAQREQAARSSATCREDASEGGATSWKTSMPGSWAKLYGPQPRHVAETVPVLRAERVQDDATQGVLGFWLVAFPVLLAALGVIL